ncbi:MAG: hypothetical protein ACK4UQ_06710 [Brevundimonas sp.]
MAISYLYRIRPGSTVTVAGSNGPQIVDLHDYLVSMAHGLGLRAIGSRPLLTVTAWTDHDELAWFVGSRAHATPLLTFKPAA